MCHSAVHTRVREQNVSFLKLKCLCLLSYGGWFDSMCSLPLVNIVASGKSMNETSFVPKIVFAVGLSGLRCRVDRPLELLSRMSLALQSTSSAVEQLWFTIQDKGNHPDNGISLGQALLVEGPETSPRMSITLIALAIKVPFGIEITQVKENTGVQCGHRH